MRYSRIFQSYLMAPHRAKWGGRKGCIFCEIVKEYKKTGKRSTNFYWIFFVEKHTMGLVNPYPYVPKGHVQVVMLRHVRDLEGLTQEEEIEFWKNIKRTLAAVKKEYKTKDVNIGINIGKRAGASIPDHLHAQIVPRKEIETGFMEVCFSTRVIPEHPEVTREKLEKYFG